MHRPPCDPDLSLKASMINYRKAALIGCQSIVGPPLPGGSRGCVVPSSVPVPGKARSWSVSPAGGEGASPAAFQRREAWHRGQLPCSASLRANVSRGFSRFLLSLLGLTQHLKTLSNRDQGGVCDIKRCKTESYNSEKKIIINQQNAQFNLKTGSGPGGGAEGRQLKDLENREGSAALRSVAWLLLRFRLVLCFTECCILPWAGLTAEQAPPRSAGVWPSARLSHNVTSARTCKDPPGSPCQTRPRRRFFQTRHLRWG